MMKVKELIEQLQIHDPEATVITGCWNGHTETYGVVDHCWQHTYDEVSNDFYGTPGKMDERLLKDNIENFVYVGSEFPWNHAFGNDDINYPIETINGQDGDPDLIWKLNNFEKTEREHWVKEIENDDGFEATIDYHPILKLLTVMSRKKHGHTRVVNIVEPGIEDLRNAVKLCQIDLPIMC